MGDRSVDEPVAETDIVGVWSYGVNSNADQRQGHRKFHVHKDEAGSLHFTQEIPGDGKPCSVTGRVKPELELDEDGNQWHKDDLERSMGKDILVLYYCVVTLTRSCSSPFLRAQKEICWSKNQQKRNAKFECPG